MEIKDRKPRRSYNLRKCDLLDLKNCKLPSSESMSGLLQTHKRNLHPFYWKGIEQTLGASDPEEMIRVEGAVSTRPGTEISYVQYTPVNTNGF